MGGSAFMYFKAQKSVWAPNCPKCRSDATEVIRNRQTILSKNVEIMENTLISEQFTREVSNRSASNYVARRSASKTSLLPPQLAGDIIVCLTLNHAR